MFQKKLELIFLFITFTAISLLAYNFHQSYSFKNNDIPLKYKELISQKETEVLGLMKKHYGVKLQVPLIVTDKFKGALYGLTSYENGEIKIYLNKKVMKESMDYMIDSVIAHEYAHALMFKLGYFQESDKGHSKTWQDTCTKLGGVDCQQYVDHKEIIMSKIPFR